MNTAIAIFVKTPELSPVKTRLRQEVGKNVAQRFFDLATNAIEEVVLEVQRQSNGSVKGYWAVAEEAGLCSTRWQKLARLHTGQGGLGSFRRFRPDRIRILPFERLANGA